jgi:hypothetical protein
VPAAVAGPCISPCVAPGSEELGHLLLHQTLDELLDHIPREARVVQKERLPFGTGTAIICRYFITGHWDLLLV